MLDLGGPEQPGAGAEEAQGGEARQGVAGLQGGLDRVELFRSAAQERIDQSGEDVIIVNAAQAVEDAVVEDGSVLEGVVRHGVGEGGEVRWGGVRHVVHPARGHPVRGRSVRGRRGVNHAGRGGVGFGVGLRLA